MALSDEQMERMIELRNQWRNGDITEAEHDELVNVEVFGLKPKVQVEEVPEIDEPAPEVADGDFPNNVPITVTWDELEKLAAVGQAMTEAAYNSGGTGPFPELTPDIMNTWMGEWGESFMADGPINPPRELSDKLEADFVAKVNAMDKPILDILLANNCNDPIEAIWDVYIDDLTEEQENVVYQLYCDTVNTLGINTTSAFDKHEDEDDDYDDEEE